MIVHIIRERGFVQAMGHRVALHLGGEPELKRRVLASIAQLDDPPDELAFRRVEPEQPEAATHAAAASADPATPSESEPPAPAEPEPEPRPKPPTPPPRRGKKGK